MTEFESVTSTIALDFAQRTSPVTVFAKQGDENTRHITIQPLVNGVPMVIGRDEQFAARFAAKKPDGKYVYNDSASLREDNLIHVTLTDQTLAAHGNALCCIVLTNGEGKTLTSQNFTLIIEYSAGAYKNLASSDEILGLDAKLAQVQALLDQLGEEIRPLPPITEADKNKVLTAGEDGTASWETAAGGASVTEVSSSTEITTSSPDGFYVVPSKALVSTHTEVDLSKMDAEGLIEEKVTETFDDDTQKVTTKTTRLEFDAEGNPIKITDNDGNETVLTW